jgi:Tfp pilus assembly protein PilF
VAAGDNINLAAFFYQKAAISESKAEQPVAGPFFRAYRFYVIQDRWVEALQILQQGVEALPKNVKLRLTLANAYEHQGITYRAEEEYRQALIIAPGDPHIKAEIDRLVGS